MNITGEAITTDEINAYHKYVADNLPGQKLIGIHIDGDFVDLEIETIPFERMRRITGYLVGSTTRWNNAKKAELSDRVKHSDV